MDSQVLPRTAGALRPRRQSRLLLRLLRHKPGFMRPQIRASYVPLQITEDLWIIPEWVSLRVTMVCGVECGRSTHKEADVGQVCCGGCGSPVLCRCGFATSLWQVGVHGKLCHTAGRVRRRTRFLSTQPPTPIGSFPSTQPRSRSRRDGGTSGTRCHAVAILACCCLPRLANPYLCPFVPCPTVRAAGPHRHQHHPAAGGSVRHR